VGPQTIGNDLTDNAIFPFQVGETAVRGHVVRLSGVIDDILQAHQFADPVSCLVGEAASLAAMMGAALKFDGKLIFQAQGDGPVSMLVAGYTAGGALPATASLRDGDIAQTGMALLGKGHIVMTIDQGADMERYQGVTPIEGGNLAEAAVAYFKQSEQIPTVIRLAVGRVSAPGEPESWRAGGIMAQFVPGEGGTRERGEEILKSDDDRDVWARVAAFVGTAKDDELLDPAISAETLLYRLFHEDGVRAFEPQPVRAECGCKAEKISAVLSRYSEDELHDMVEAGAIKVVCEFCRKDYHFTPQGEPSGAP
jgi:molecular chaperone Hsp33